MTRSYPEPFVPTTFSCWVTRTTTKVLAVDKRTGERRPRTADRWDVKGRANGIEYARRFARAGLAEAWKDQLWSEATSPGCPSTWPPSASWCPWTPCPRASTSGIRVGGSAPPPSSATPSLAPDGPRQPKLSRLRHHDLRHAACSWWLREGVDTTVCQRWSGHKTLSVFLDIYQGVAPGREDEGVGRLVGSLPG